DQTMIDKYLDNNMLIERPDQPEYFGLEKVGPDIPEEDKDKDKVKQLKKKQPKQYFTPIKKLGSIYELVNAAQIRNERATALLNSLTVLRGGAKQAAFGTDVAPKVLVMA